MLLVVFLVDGVSEWAPIHSSQIILVMRLQQETEAGNDRSGQCDGDPCGSATDFAK